MENNRIKYVTFVLVCLVLWDITLTIIGYSFPDFWFSIFHGADYIDPQGYLPRAAGNWLMFAVLQFIALIKWRQQPVWLAMVAAVRLSDALTDWSCLYFSETVTMMGKPGLFASGVINLMLGWFFYWAWAKSEGKKFSIL